jgi:hypothetical protein
MEVPYHHNAQHIHFSAFSAHTHVKFKTVLLLELVTLRQSCDHHEDGT